MLNLRQARILVVLFVLLGSMACRLSVNLDGTRILRISEQGVELVAEGETPVFEDQVVTQDIVEETGDAPTNGVSTAGPSSTPRSFEIPERDTEQEFSTVDRPDDVEGFQIHFVYAIPNDGVDGLLDVNGEIELSALAMNAWLERQTEGSRLRYDTYQGKLDVSFIQLPYSGDEISSLGTDVLQLMEYEIKTRGFDSERKLYIVHYDGFFVASQGFCGLASYPPDGWGVVGMLFLRGYIPEYDLPCPRQFTQSADYTGYFEMTILHELLHLMGMAPQCGDKTEDGHVTDSSQDLMYYQYDGSYSPLYTYLDYNNNDYFRHGIADCPDFANSIFLEPLPENAELPPAWNRSSDYLPSNPFGE